MKFRSVIAAAHYRYADRGGGMGGGAPAAIQAASTCRSSSVISVMLPGGMASERTALISIRRA